MEAVSRPARALATQIPNRLAERLRVGNLPSGRLTYVAPRIHDVHLVSHANLLEMHAAKPPLQVRAVGCPVEPQSVMTFASPSAECAAS